MTGFQCQSTKFQYAMFKLPCLALMNANRITGPNTHSYTTLEHLLKPRSAWQRDSSHHKEICAFFAVFWDRKTTTILWPPRSPDLNVCFLTCGAYWGDTCKVLTLVLQATQLSEVALPASLKTTSKQIVQHTEWNRLDLDSRQIRN